MKSEVSMTKILNRVLTAWLGIAMLLFTAAPVFAHGGFDHVKGTVIKTSHNVLTVKTLRGNVAIKLNEDNR